MEYTIFVKWDMVARRYGVLPHQVGETMDDEQIDMVLQMEYEEARFKEDEYRKATQKGKRR